MPRVAKNQDGTDKVKSPKEIAATKLNKAVKKLLAYPSKNNLTEINQLALEYAKAYKAAQSDDMLA